MGKPEQMGTPVEAEESRLVGQVFDLLLRVLGVDVPGEGKEGEAVVLSETGRNELGRCLRRSNDSGAIREKDWIQKRLAHGSHHELQTSSLVLLKSNGWYGPHVLHVSGASSPIKLRRQRSFILMKVLLGEAQRGNDFVSVADLIELIEDECKGLTTADGTPFWEFPMAQDVHKEISIIRGKIRLAGANDKLVETCPGGTGYRISTLSEFVQIEGCPDADDG